MTDDTCIRTYIEGRTKEKGHVDQMNPSLFIFTTNSSSFMASQQWKTRKRQKCGIYTPVGRKVWTFIIAQITICYTGTFLLRMLLLRNAGKRLDRWHIFQIRVCICTFVAFFLLLFFLFFKYSSKISVTFEKCQVNVSSMQLYQKEFESFAFYICIISLNSPFSINFVDKLPSKN